MMSTRLYLCVTFLYLAVPSIRGAEMPAGLTFGQAPQEENAYTSIVSLTCGKTSDGQENICDPYFGDTPCQEPLPLLCFIDINAPAPSYLSNPRHWSGGLVAITDDIRGDRFSTIGQANAYCAQNFGKGWRVASFHDGGGWALSAYGGAGQMAQRVWVDIKDQAKGTCWSR